MYTKYMYQPCMIFGVFMNVEEILNLDCSNGTDELVEELANIKPLKKVFLREGEIKIEYIEKVIRIIDKKYNFGIRSLVPDCGSNKNSIVWRAAILDYKTINVMKQIFGLTLYEVMAKVAIYMYYKSIDREV